MPPTPLDWTDFGLRIVLALVAGALLGIDRTARGRPAGLRTTMMVCSSAAVAMILGDVVWAAGSSGQGGGRVDPLRMAQGLLQGMGFIGAGAIIRRSDVVHGITTAATLWFATIVGLSLGAGQWALGGAGVAAGLIVLWPMYHLEELVPRERTGNLSVTAPVGSMTEQDLRAIIEQNGYSSVSWSMEVDRAQSIHTMSCRVLWKAKPTEDGIPSFVTALSMQGNVISVKWQPATS